MMREAESHADEDRKRKEEIETRNQADQSVYAAERLIKEAGDKISAADRQPVEASIESLKKAIEQNDVAGMKSGMESLNAAQHKIAEAMYRASQAAGPQGPASEPTGEGAASGGRPSGDVIDAEVVEEEKK